MKLAWIGVLTLLSGLAAAPTRLVAWDFSADEPGQIAQGFATASGKWSVSTDGDNKVLTQRAENRIDDCNIAFATAASYRDVELTVRIRAVTGETEQGGGLIWRAKDKDNFYAVRFNPLVPRNGLRRPNLRLYKMEAGKLTQLDHADVAGGDRDWHTLRITMVGGQIIGELDGRKLLEADDTSFLDVGQIGLWTRADAVTEFDDLSVAAR